ncbi:transmembrane protein, putative (macronuclear) [Tetrahymena thermophila SB210]|uniref:Transmembrane protein, putative n=1 Tax=Tetrahymena thermophila (strain SB210) TaxID=312017 RepID=Q22AM0_TETTS|nr:transmembrane protein, putative [Tetrahymena thermophila SB210]EAR82336.2 transmembrane protein, putative [Tetrahymena thermophila SB210]|eukprot:XP_001029999.2 transmembrane protein, putative [Tetrahymena thermophila SB210]
MPKTFKSQNIHSDDDSQNFKIKRSLQGSQQLQTDEILYVTPLKKEMYPEPLFQDERLFDFEEPITIIQVNQSSSFDITFDLRHIYDLQDSLEFKYNRDWDIAIAVNNTFYLDSWRNQIDDYIIVLPETFENDNIIKEDSHKFNLFAYYDLNVMVFIRILNSTFSSFRTLFFQTVTFNIKTPYRSIYNQNKIFAFVLQNEGIVNLPLNLPNMTANTQNYPNVIISYSTANSSDSLFPQNITQESIYSSYVNNDRFWVNMQQLTIPYIPYFSNCKNYGQFMYLHDIIEDGSICDLVTPQETKPVKQLGFQTAPVSDKCEVEIECIMDEAFVSSNALPKLYEQPILTNLFYVVTNPIDLNEVTENNLIFKPEELIPIIASNQIPQGHLPTSIELKLSYYQVDKYTKKIIEAEIKFGSSVDITTLHNQDQFQYKLIFNFHSMNHAELAITFALKWSTYLVLSSIIGTFCGHEIDQYQRRGRLGASLVIIGFYLLIRISIVFVPETTEERVYHQIKNYTQRHQNKQYNLLTILDHLSDRLNIFMTQSYDGNIWREKVWKRAIYLFLIMWILIIVNVIITLSFSLLFATNIWFFIFLFKINQIFVLECTKIYVENELQLGTLACTMLMNNSISGLGAPDFFEYLFNTFVNLGISTYEKTIQVLLVEFCSQNTFKMVARFKKWLDKQFSPQDEQESLDDDVESSLELQNNQKGEDNEIIEQDNHKKGKDFFVNSEIMLTENYQESFGTNDDIKIQQENITDFQQQVLEQENIQREKQYSKESLGDMSQCQMDQSFQSKYLVDEDQFEDTFQSVFDKKFMKGFKKQNNKNHQEDLEKENKKEEEELRFKQNKIFSDFCYNTFTVLATPFQVIALWIFYDSNKMFVRWVISKEGLVFYYLFNVWNIPFQIFVDILLLKSVEQIHQVSIKEYVNLCRERFKNRKFNWKADDTTDALKCLEPTLQKIDVWCFSSQYFFCLSVFVSGMICVLQGVQTIQINKFNLFADKTLVFLLIFWVLLCFLIEQVCYFFYNHTSLWKKASSESNQEDEKEKIISKEKNATELLAKINNINIIENKCNTQLQELDLDCSPIIQPQNYDSIVQNKESIKQNRFLKNISKATHFQDITNVNMLGVRNELFNSGFQLNSLNASRQSLFSNNLYQQNIIEKKLTETILQRVQFQNNQTQQNQEQEDQMQKRNQEFIFKEQAKFIKNNYYIQLYLKEEIQNVEQYDISVQNFIHDHLSCQNKFHATIQEKIEEFIKRAKNQLSNKQIQQQWLSFSSNFQKAYHYKEKKQKILEKKIRFLKNEYQDEKFLKKFLIINKTWLKKNIKNMAYDIIRGPSSSTEDQSRLRNEIIEQFKIIGGNLKEATVISSSIQVQPVQGRILSQKVSQQIQGTYIQGIIKYWKMRSQILQIAEQCIGGFMLKSQNSYCEYCWNQWGLLVQAKENIEDTFNLYYKYECSFLKAYFNVKTLYEQDSLILDTKGYEKDLKKIKISNKIFFLNTKFLEEDIYHEDLLQNWENSKEDNFNSLQNKQGKEYTSVLKENLKENLLKQFYVQDISSDIRVNQHKKTFNRKRFIERWQEFFFLNTTFQTICLKCNDMAQDQFLKNIQEYKRKPQQVLKQQQDLIKKQLKDLYQKQNDLSKLDEQDEFDNSNEVEEEIQKQGDQNTFFQTKSINQYADVIHEENQEEDEEKLEKQKEDNDVTQLQDIEYRKINKEQSQEQEQVEECSVFTRNTPLKTSSFSQHRQQKLNSQDNLIDDEDNELLLDKQKSPLYSNSPPSKSIYQLELQNQLSSINNEVTYENDYLTENISQRFTKDQKVTVFQEEQESSSDSSDSSELSEQMNKTEQCKKQTIFKSNDISIDKDQQKDFNSKKESKIYTHNDCDDISSDSSCSSSNSNIDPQKIIQLTEKSRKSKKSFKSYESKTHPISSESFHLELNKQEKNLSRMSQAEMNQYFLYPNTGKNVQLRKFSTNQSHKLINIPTTEGQFPFLSLSQKLIQENKKINFERDIQNNSKYEENKIDQQNLNQIDEQSNQNS